MLPEAVETVTAAVTAALSAAGNASSLHAAGRRARRVVEESRERLAAAVGARPSEVVFTGSGTESDNLAVKGIWWSRRDADPRRTRVLASAVEHHAVLDAAQWLADHEGAVVEWLEVDDQGRVHPDVLREAIERDPSDVALVSVMWANNEVGTVQPVRRLADVCHEHGIPLHSDAVQAVGQLPVDVAASGVDALTLTGHKFGGPLGVGALVLGRDIACTPLLHGGGQERDLRSGTLDTPAVAGLAVAAALAVERQPELHARLSALRDGLVRRVQDVVPGAVLNGVPCRRPTACRATRTSPSPTARATRCCCCSTPAASRSRPAPRARPGSRGPATSCSPWAPTRNAPAGRCASPSATPRPEADVDALVAALPAVVERARRAVLR
jgi:cysteine desulfurase